jgi:DNA-binding IclR family transcriptional regulator
MKTDTAISKGVEILRLLANGINRLSDITQHLGLSNSTAHRVLKNLEDTGLIIQDPLNRHYYLGSEILLWASKESVSHQHIVISSSAELEHLQKITGETVFICKRIGTKKIVINELPSTYVVNLTYGKGFCAPIYSGATGKALLSLLNDRDLNHLLDNMQLIAVTERTIIERDILLSEIQKVREKGYAISFGDAAEGSAAISVPLQDGTRLFSLTIVGPENRFKPQNVVFDAIRSADKISKLLNPKS